MKVYTLYLSTLTGSSTQAIFNGYVFTALNTVNATVSSSTTITFASASSVALVAGMSFIVAGSTTTGSIQSVASQTSITTTSAVSIANGSTLYFFSSTGGYLYVPAITSGSLAINQYIVVNGSVNQISALGSGTGGTGWYSLSTSTITNTTINVFTSYTLQSNPPKYAPIAKTNLSQIKWSINWKEIFGNRQGECRVRVRLISSSSTSLNWASNTGSLRASFQSTCANSNAGFNLGYIRPQSDYTSGTSNTTYLDLDTTQSNGSTIIIPNTNGDFYLTIFNSSELPMTGVPDYQVWILFDTDDENPLEYNDSKDVQLSSIYKPR
jgi:hypothetical protein